MTSKELFIKSYNAHINFESAAEFLLIAGIPIDESKFSDAFYTLFDAIIPIVLTEEGQEHFYEDILYKDFTLGEILESLEEYFI